MSFRIEFFDHVVVNGVERDFEIDTQAEIVRLRNGLGELNSFRAGEVFAQLCAEQHLLPSLPIRETNTSPQHEDGYRRS